MVSIWYLLIHLQPRLHQNYPRLCLFQKCALTKITVNLKKQITIIIGIRLLFTSWPMKYYAHFTCIFAWPFHHFRIDGNTVSLDIQQNADVRWWRKLYTRNLNMSHSEVRLFTAYLLECIQIPWNYTPPYFPHSFYVHCPKSWRFLRIIPHRSNPVDHRVWVVFGIAANIHSHRYWQQSLQWLCSVVLV